MITFRKVLLAAVATLLVAGGCTSINVPTVPPINIPSIPPVNIPSIPPIGGLPGVIPSGLTIPPIPGLSIPPGNATCALVSAAEVGQVLGSQVTDESEETTNCSFLLPNFTDVSVQTTSDTDFSGVTFLMGQSAQQSTIAGFPALSGTVIGQPVVYVQKPSGQLEVLGVLMGSDPATIAKLQQIATVAVARMP